MHIEVPELRADVVDALEARVRVDASSTAGIDLAAIKSGEPSRLHHIITAHPRYGSPIPLAQLLEH